MSGFRLSLLNSLYRNMSSLPPHSPRLHRPLSRLSQLGGPSKSSPMMVSPFLNNDSFNLRAIASGYPHHGPKSSPFIVSKLSLFSAATKPSSYSSYARSFTSKSDNGNGIDWFNKAKDVFQTSADTVSLKAKEASPHLQQFLDSNPYLKEVIGPVSLTLTATLFAWVIMPRVLRMFHRYAMRSSAAFLPGGFSNEDVPYDKSFWGALEDPARYLLTFTSFAQIAMMVAPTTITSQYFYPALRGALILSLVWFLHRWKTNVFTRMLLANTFAGVDREKILTMDKVSSVGLFAIGLMASAEACGVAVQSVLTVGGVGGVATAFAAKDILGNVLSGMSMQFSKPFSIGDTIKAGSVEGQVVEMGLTKTSLLNAEKFPVLVPNSLFSSQMIVNKSRAQWRAISSKIPLEVDDLDKIPDITNEIKERLRSNTKVFLGKEAPYCYLSRVEKSFAELTIGCNLKYMGKDELYTTQQEVLIESVKIIKKHGASLGTNWENSTV